jgi:hypothetical protein
MTSSRDRSHFLLLLLLLLLSVAGASLEAVDAYGTSPIQVRGI